MPADTACNPLFSQLTNGTQKQGQKSKKSSLSLFVAVPLEYARKISIFPYIYLTVFYVFNIIQSCKSADVAQW